MTASHIPTFVVANRTGGQGKTLVSQVIHFGYLLAGHKLHVVAADSSKVEGGKSKIGQIMDNSRVCPIQVEELGIGASMDTIKADARSAISYWDGIGPHLKGGSSVIDLGANILPQVLEWAKQRKANRLLAKSDIALVVPVTAQRQSIIDALQMINEARHADSELRFKTIYVVFNGYHGPFKDVEKTTEMEILLDLVRNNVVTRIDMKRCGTEVWERVEANFMSLVDLAQLDHEAYARDFGLNEFEASGAHVEFVDWLNETHNAFRAAGLLPRALVEDSLQPAA
jgi:hypothetical protein